MTTTLTLLLLMPVAFGIFVGLTSYIVHNTKNRVLEQFLNGLLLRRQDGSSIFGCNCKKQ